MRHRQDLRRGLLASLPLVPGVVVFGLLYGMMARQVGLGPYEAWAMSAIVHAGSAQFIALGMWPTAGAAAIILTTFVVNLRHLLLGASITPYLQGLSPGWKALLALWMSDESYALAITAYRQGTGSRWHFLGANLGIYLAWTTSGLLGALLGMAIPDPGRYGLDLVFPLAFLGLLVTFLDDRISVAVALAAGVLALAGRFWLPGAWYVIVAGLLGSVIGLLLEGWRRGCTTS
jgi:4-azaleucine resistance transporter AzlC